MVSRRKKVSSEEPTNTEQPIHLTEKPVSSFEVRQGDQMTVMYRGAKLQIAPFSTAELDSASYTRMLEPGDDLIEQWDRIYLYLRDRSLAGAREKLATLADELASAKQRAMGKQ